jgi:uncharacterized Zn-binding protein involved in type VI secretion
MPQAARLTDPTNHAGTIAGPGVPNVLIGGMPAAVAGDTHICGVPQPHPPSVFPKGSATVYIGGRPALRQLDTAGCGAQIALGATTVMIGG